MDLKVELPASLLSQLEGEAVKAAPNEACALLLGDRAGQDLRVEAIAISHNVSTADPRTTFEIDPALYIRLQKAARAGGPQVIGVWHSHPGGTPEPSDTDKAQSVEAGWLCVITAVNQGRAESASFLADDHDPHTMRPVRSSP